MGAGRGLWPRSCVVLTGSVLLSTMGGRLVMVVKNCWSVYSGYSVYSDDL